MTTNIKTYVIAGIVSLIVAGGIWLALPAKTTTVTTAASFGNTSIDGSQSNLPNPSNYDYLVARLGLGLGTNVSNSNTGVGNLNIESQKMVLIASTTPCAIQNPTGATSTIINFALNVTTSTSTATSFAIGTSTTQYATTTTMETAGLGAGSQGTITWDPGVNNSVIGPGQWIVAGNALGQVFYPFATGGSCSATFETV